MAPRRSREPEVHEGTRLLDRYSILDRIGSGGMATIYRATDDRLDRVVCVKLLRTMLDTSTTGENAIYEATYSHFLREALALSKLSHPNTLRIYDFGYFDAPGDAPESGAPFHVSEYLDGGNLETRVRFEGAISVDETLSIFDGITGAVAEAHEHAIIHRDIKPSNIIFARVSAELVPKLADFGIAQSNLRKSQAPEVSGESVSTVALFSPRWAAPEQLCGAPEGPRTDVYALGLLATFMLSGKILFGDDDVRTTFNDRVRGDTLVNARLAQMGVGGEVARVLMHSMTARADDRIATARAFFEELRRALTPVKSAPPARAPDPPPLPYASTLALEVEAQKPAPERIQEDGERRVRFVQVHEKLDLSFMDAGGGQVRVRVTILPGGEKLNVKGLTCFVAHRGQRPTPALTVVADGTLDLVAANHQRLGDLTCWFGQAGPNGRLFVVDGKHLLVPYSEAQQAVALTLSPGRDLVVMCRR